MISTYQTIQKNQPLNKFKSISDNNCLRTNKACTRNIP